MDVQQLSEKMDEIDAARRAMESAQCAVAVTIVNEYRDLLELIDAGVVKPCIPMSILHRVRTNR